MAHVWNLIKKDHGGRWDSAALAGEGCVVVCYSDGVELRSPAGVGQMGLDSILILPAGGYGSIQRWALLAGRQASVRVNGLPLALGILALNDRDEIVAGVHRMFFSTEELARVMPFPGLAQPAFCPRCKQRIEIGDPAVCCPTCHAWSHQTEKFPCWTYNEAPCAMCQRQATTLDAGYNFNPATL